MLSLVKHNDAILNTPIPEFDFTVDHAKAPGVSVALIEILEYYKALGVSANQIGLHHRVFAMRTDDGIITCFNPKIVNAIGEQVFREGCLSFPGLDVKVYRPSEIRARYADIHGNVNTKTFEGLAATVFQHELDHLNGVVFIDRANFLNKGIAKKKWNKLKGKTW